MAPAMPAIRAAFQRPNLFPALNAVSHPAISPAGIGLGSQPTAGGLLHGFGPGGAVTSSPPVSNAPNFARTTAGLAGAHHGESTQAGGVLGGLASQGSLDAPALRGLGQGRAAARLWLQRHPFASHHGNIPNWVEHDLTATVNGASPGTADPMSRLRDLLGQIQPYDGLPPQMLNRPSPLQALTAALGASGGGRSSMVAE